MSQKHSLISQNVELQSLHSIPGGGGNFHLKVGGAKSSGNAGDPMLGVAVSGGSRIYKRGAGCLLSLRPHIYNYNHQNHGVGGGQK